MDAKPRRSERHVPPEAIIEVEPLIGQVIIAWAFLDMALEFWLMEIFPVAAAANLGAKMPSQFERRIGYLRKAFEALPELAHLKTKTNLLLDAACEQTEFRHALAHGTISHYTVEPEKALIFVKLRYDRGQGIHVANEWEFGFRALAEIAQAVRQITGIAHELRAQIAEALHPPR